MLSSGGEVRARSREDRRRQQDMTGRAERGDRDRTAAHTEAEQQRGSNSKRRREARTAQTERGETAETEEQQRVKAERF